MALILQNSAINLDASLFSLDVEPDSFKIDSFTQNAHKPSTRGYQSKLKPLLNIDIETIYEYSLLEKNLKSIIM